MVGYPKPVKIVESKIEKARRYANNRRKALLVTTRARKGIKRKRAKLPSIKSLVKKADILFARFIRQRGGNKCVLCGSTNNPTCGHLIKRAKKMTRYSTINCNVLCSGCNYKDNFDHEPYVLWWIEEYGLGAYKLMYEISQQFHKWTREELQEIIRQYETKD